MVQIHQTQEIIQTITPKQQRKLARFSQRIKNLGANCYVFNLQGDTLLCSEQGGGDDTSRQELVREAINLYPQSSDLNQSEIQTSNDIQYVETLGCVLVSKLNLSVPDQSNLDGQGVIVIDWRNQTSSENHTIDSNRIVFTEMLSCLADSFDTTHQADRQMEMVGSELSQVYEELVLLHKLSTNMKVTESDANFLQLACDSLTEVVSVEGIAIVIERWQEYDRTWSVVAGSGLIDLDRSMATTVYGRLVEEIEKGREALLDSDVFSTFKYAWSDSIRNIIAVPLYGKDIHESHLVQRCKGKEAMIGYMVAINALHKKDFDSTDIKLFNSVANRCAVFIENGRLFGDLQELFMGSLRALTSSIDAKDGYTHGHSERVALISRWIADHAVEAQLLTPEQAEESYFSGLLHDIGKIGIEDWVLRKEGPLTEEELERIHNHPLIGAGILRGIKQMRHIVPGVLHHHERFDGKGYPNNLQGEEIPILARIVCLADSFDAMTSRRSYRKAMSIEQATTEIEKNLGKQFDPEFGKVFLETDMDRLWQLMQGGSETIYGRDIPEYGANAVGTLVR